MGWGHGVLVSLLAAQLSTGSVVGVDRSATMIAAASRRKQAELDHGRVRLQATTLADAVLTGGAVLLATVEDGVRRLAGERGLVVTEVHRGATTPFPSAAIDLRRST